MTLVRGSSLHSFADLVEELGGDVDALLRAARLPRRSLDSPDDFIDYRSVVAVLENAARSLAAPDFGRQLAARQGLEILGPLGVAARTAPTVGAALAAIETFMASYSPALQVGVSLLDDGRRARFDWRLVMDRAPVHHQAAELGLGVATRVVRVLAGTDFRPTAVHLRHAALVDARDYRRYFGCPVSFSAPAYGFTFRASVLTRSLEADSEVHEIARSYLNSIVYPSEPTTVDVVTHLIRTMMPTGTLDLDLVAEQLAQHRRTLQRHLAAQGTSFGALVDEVRRAEAERYLADTEMPLGQLAGVLGFTEQSALTRACRRWFGCPPSTLRTRLRGGTSGSRISSA